MDLCGLFGPLQLGLQLWSAFESPSTQDQTWTRETGRSCERWSKVLRQRDHTGIPKWDLIQDLELF